jgi:hypothetical protein
MAGVPNGVQNTDNFLFVTLCWDWITFLFHFLQLRPRKNYRVMQLPLQLSLRQHLCPVRRYVNAALLQL